MNTKFPYTRVDLSSVRGGIPIIAQRMPDLPAIYAFFRRIPSVSTGSAEQFYADILSLVEATAAPAHSNNLGPLHLVSLESRSTLSSRKREKLHELAASGQFRRLMSQVVEAATGLQSPLYVGKTVSLQTRIGQHLDPMSPLATRLRAVGIQITDCIITYTLIPAESQFYSNDTLLLIEEIVTRFLRPGFVLRAG
jgi:hypothetical protein